jgi:hypothetical protein
MVLCCNRINEQLNAPLENIAKTQLLLRRTGIKFTTSTPTLHERYGGLFIALKKEWGKVRS